MTLVNFASSMQWLAYIFRVKLYLSSSVDTIASLEINDTFDSRIPEIIDKYSQVYLFRLGLLG